MKPIRNRIALLIFAAATCHADEDSDQLFNMSLQELSNVRITGVSLRAQHTAETPASTTTFSRNIIDRLCAITLSDLYRHVPGLQAFRSNQNNTTSLSMRGRLAGVSSREILLVIDGVRMEDWSTGASVYNMGEILLANVKQVEFIRGPVSQIYGANAFMGVINITTGNPDNGIQALTGNQLNSQVSLNYSTQLGQVKHHITLESRNERGQDYSVISPFDPTQSVKVEDPATTQNASYTASAYNWKLHTKTFRRISNGFYSIGGVQNDHSDYDYTLNTINLTHNNNWSEHFDTMFNVGYKAYDFSQESVFVGETLLYNYSTPPSNAPLLATFVYNGSDRWANLNTRYKINPKWSTQVGYEYRNYHLSDAKLYNNYDLKALTERLIPITYYGNLDNKTTTREPAKEAIHGAFIQLNYNQSDRHLLSIGARFDDSELAGHNTSPKFSYIYKATASHTLKLIYSEAFRAPNANEYFIKNNPIQKGNPDLKAETVATSEFIWQYEKHSSRLHAGYYYNHFDGSITQENPDGSRVFNNQGKNHNQGVEISFHTSLNRHWNTRLSYSNIFDLNTDAFRLVKNQALALLNYNYQKWNLVFDVHYAGPSAYLNSSAAVLTPIDGYTTFNSQFSYRASEHLTLLAKGRNLLDKHYYSATTGTSNSAVPEKGRNIELGIKWRF